MPNPKDEPEHSLDFFIRPRDLISAAVGGLIVFVVQRRLARLKSIDDQRSDLRKELKEFVRDIEDKGYEYWSRDAAGDPLADGLASRDINRRFDRAMGTSDLLSREYPKRREELQTKFVTFKQAVTGGQFQSANRTADPARCLTISENANELRSCITALGLRLRRR